MSVFFSLEAKGPMLYYKEPSHCHRCFLSQLCPGKLETLLWENASRSHLAPFVSTHVVIRQDQEISVGRRFCLPRSFSAPALSRSALAIPFPSVSLVAGEEFSQIITPSERHFSN